MKNDLSSDQEFPACGYGLSGLCCSACLSGPCRISPFDRDTDRGKCGASADQLVAGNLLRMISAEAAARLAELAQLIEQFRDTDQPAVAKRAEQRPAANIFAKYGIDTAVVEQTDGVGLLANKIESLLSLNRPAGDINPLLTCLYPESVFPQFYSAELLPTGSLTLVVLSAHQSCQFNAATMEDLLQMCLKVSLVDLVCQELIQDSHILFDEKPSRVTQSIETDVIETLDPALASRGAVLLSVPEDELKRKTETFRKQWQGPLIEISRPAGLFDIGRQFYRRWSRPVADTAPLVVALSPSAAQVVGILVCGYTVVSWPGLPVFGCEPVRRFFCEELKPVFGSVYLPQEAGDVLSVAQNYCRKTP